MNKKKMNSKRSVNGNQTQSTETKLCFIELCCSDEFNDSVVMDLHQNEPGHYQNNHFSVNQRSETEFV